MGRVRVPGHNFGLDYLQSEVQTFREMIQRSSWLSHENLELRRGIVRGLTFVMLNLSDETDSTEAWRLFHEVMDDYHDRCDRLHVAY